MIQAINHTNFLEKIIFSGEMEENLDFLISVFARIQEGDGNFSLDIALEPLRVSCDYPRILKLYNLFFSCVNFDISKAGVIKENHDDRAIQRACGRIGFMYRKGHGVHRNAKLAKQYFSGMIELNDPMGHMYIGSMYRRGDVVTQDVEKAFKCFQKAANKGLSQGYMNLGSMYYHGEGVEKDYCEARKCWEKACETIGAYGYDEHIAQVYRDLGVMYQNGEGVEKDEEQANLYILKSFAAELKQKKSI